MDDLIMFIYPTLVLFSLNNIYFMKFQHTIIHKYLQCSIGIQAPSFCYFVKHVDQYIPAEKRNKTLVFTYFCSRIDCLSIACSVKQCNTTCNDVYLK